MVRAAETVTEKRFAELFSARIWGQLGVEHDAYVRCDGLGEAVPSFGISATLRDIGRWGQMCLQNGKWNGHQMVPAEFFADLQKTALGGKPLTEESGAGITVHWEPGTEVTFGFRRMTATADIARQVDTDNSAGSIRKRVW